MVTITTPIINSNQPTVDTHQHRHPIQGPQTTSPTFQPNTITTTSSIVQHQQQQNAVVEIDPRLLQNHETSPRLGQNSLEISPRLQQNLDLLRQHYDAINQLSDQLSDDEPFREWTIR